MNSSAPFDATYIVICLIISALCGAFSGALAKEKGYNSTNWFLGGVFFWIIGLIAAAGLPDKILRSKFTNEIIVETKL